MFFQSTRYARRALLTTVSAAALVLVVNGQTEAQNAAPAWWVSIEGQYTWVEGDALDFYGLTADPEDGWAGRLHGGGMISDDYSLSAGIRYGATSKERDSATYIYSDFEETADVSYEENHLVLDLEIGRHVGLGEGGTARIFGGLRFARFDGDGDGSFYSSFTGDSAELSSTHRFTGIGPRIGVDANIPVAENVRVDFGLAGAMLYGKRKGKIKGSYSSFYGENSGSISESKKKNVWVPNLEASVALTYLLGPNTSLSAGYKAEQFWNIMPTIDGSGEGGGFGKDDRLIHGPFLRLTISGN